MKKFLYILPVVLCILFSGCSDDNNADAEGVIGVVSSKVSFTAAGGTGTIKLEAGSGVSVTTDREWCTATVSGDVVTVTAQPNMTVDGRTCLVVLTSGGLKSNIPVTQYGVTIKTEPNEVTLKGRGGQAEVIVSCDVPFKAEALEEWMEVEMRGDTLIVKAGASTDAQNIRSGKVLLTVGDELLSTELVVNQLPLTMNYEEFLGRWVFRHDRNVNDTVTLSTKVENESFLVEGLFFDFVLKYHEDGGTVELLTQTIGRAGANTVKICPWEVDGKGNLTWAETAGLISEWNGNQETPILTFVDNGKYDFVVKGFILWQFDSNGKAVGEFPGGRHTYISMEKLK